MGCSVTYIEQHYDSARVENMTDYITRDVNEKSKDTFGDVILRWISLFICLSVYKQNNK